MRVFLIGSLAEGCFRATSDIDLVVEGLAPALYFRASAKISRIAGEFEVDLIPWETYKYKAEVLEKGKLLYECRRPENAASADRRGAEGNGKTSRLESERMRPLFEQLDVVFRELEKQIADFLKVLTKVAKGVAGD